MRTPSRLAWSAALAALAVAAASCGSRTGLFGPDGVLGSASTDGAAPDAPSDAGVPCIPGRFDLELATAQLMFVIDRSGSMAFSLAGQDPPPPGQKSRWRTLHDSLETVIVPFDGQISMGAKFFPEVLTPEDLADPDLSCRTETGVGIAPARGNAGSILGVFDSSVPRGGTPTAEAVRLAAQYLTTSRSVARTLVLATDGAPNCNAALDPAGCVCTTPRLNCATNPDRGRYSCLDDGRAIATVREVAEVQKIPVYVIGIGGTERPDFLRVLDDMAVAGGRARPGTPKHYNVNTQAELTDALTTIRESVARCTYLTPSSPLDPNAISVEIDGAVVFRDTTRMNGWDWIDQTFGEIAFFGAACELAQRAGAKLTGVVSCQQKK